MTRKFKVTYTVYATLELEDEVFEAVNDDFRASIYDLQDDEEIVQHLAHNLIGNQANLSQLDGWGDQLDSNADLDIDDEEIEVEEIK